MYLTKEGAKDNCLYIFFADANFFIPVDLSANFHFFFENYFQLKTMSPNAGGNRIELEAQDVGTDSEERQDDVDEKTERKATRHNHKAASSVTCLDTTFKIYLLRLLFSIKYYIKRSYVVVWRKLPAHLISYVGFSN